jgi:hypothetical protein
VPLSAVLWIVQSTPRARRRSLQRRDGLLYVITEENDAALLRIEPVE